MEPDAEEGFEGRVWFIQCKRERSFTPTKAKAVAKAALAGSEPPFGFVLAVPTDLSKRTRETLTAELRAGGVRQVHAWGKAELEDMLFLPENDHLLFAYFGVSLQARRRSQTSLLRSRLAKKREIFRTIGGLDQDEPRAVLVRDPTVAGYPYRDRVQDFDDANPPWRWTAFEIHSADPDTLILIVDRHHAWVSADRTTYDFIDTCSHLLGDRFWGEKVKPDDEAVCEQLWWFWNTTVPAAERAWLATLGFMRLDDILLIDDLGDVVNEPPHILALRDSEHGFFVEMGQRLMVDSDSDLVDVAGLKRASLFPNPIPERDPG